MRKLQYKVIQIDLKRFIFLLHGSPLNQANKYYSFPGNSPRLIQASAISLPLFFFFFYHKYQIYRYDTQKQLLHSTKPSTHNYVTNTILRCAILSPQLFHPTLNILTPLMLLHDMG
ncbi:hypothetical protein V6Z12_D05G096900 [Gossypium hirsutum]